MKLGRKIGIVATVLVLAAIAVRAVLPTIVLRYVNDRLADMGEYRGRVADVDLAVIRGAYELHDVTVVKPAARAEQPFLAMPHLDISIKWSELFNLSLEDARLVEVNPWLEEFLNVDAEAGVFSMYAELAAADGRFEGYVKPILENAEIFRLDEPSTGVLQKAWEAIVDAVGEIVETDEEQVATQIPFAGEIENPDAGLLAAAVNLLRNAFVAAFTHSLEGTVTLEDVESKKEE